jgi:hypothetical protein
VSQDANYPDCDCCEDLGEFAVITPSSVNILSLCKECVLSEEIRHKDQVEIIGYWINAVEAYANLSKVLEMK